MTILEERLQLNNGRTVVTRPPKPRAAKQSEPEPAPLPPPPVPPMVRRARRMAVLITGGIAVTSFVLSFSGLRNLAERSGIPSELAWLWPLTVDGTIIQATMAVIAVAAYPSQRSNRRFFWATLIAAASVSVGGNILHAVVTGPVPPILAAIIATIAPLSLLATTHGLAALTRFNPDDER